MKKPVTPTVDTVPVAKTPPGGWTEWPPPILAGCNESIPAGAPDLDGIWQTVEIEVGGEAQPDHPALGHCQRVEQAGDRLVVTGGGVIHDMRCDGTRTNGVHDVAEFDKVTRIHVVATYENGVHVLRPEGLDIEVRRWRDAEHMMWDYLGFTARLRWVAPSSANAEAVMTALRAGDGKDDQ